MWSPPPAVDRRHQAGRPAGRRWSPGGDLGVGLLAVNIVLQVVLLPAYMFLLAGAVTTVSLPAIARSIGIFLVGPMVAAAVTHRVAARRGPVGSQPIPSEWLPWLKTAALMAVIVAMFASQAAVLRRDQGVVAELIVPIVAFFAISFTMAIVAGRSLRLRYPQTALLAFTTTSRNSEVSLALAATAFTSPLVALAVVVGPVLELPMLLAMVRVLHRIRPWIERPRRGA